MRAKPSAVMYRGLSVMCRGLARDALPKEARDVNRLRRRLRVHPVVDDAVLDDPLDVRLGFAERDALDPLQHVGAGVARVAIRPDPLTDVTRTCVVARDCQRD